MKLTTSKILKHEQGADILLPRCLSRCGVGSRQRSSHQARWIRLRVTILAYMKGEN